MRSDKVTKWERKLKEVFDTIDADLEAQYGQDYVLHPARPKQGATSNPEADGLFNIGAAFSAGFGSRLGPGYTVEIRISTMSTVPKEIREKIKAQVFDSLKQRLPAVFSGQDLHVSEDNGMIRIHGDLSLD